MPPLYQGHFWNMPGACQGHSRAMFRAMLEPRNGHVQGHDRTMFRAMPGPYQDHVRSKPGPCSGPWQAMDHASAMARPYHEHVKTIPGPCQEHTRAMFRARKYMTVTSVKCSRHRFRSFGIICGRLTCLLPRRLIFPPAVQPVYSS